MIFCEGSREDQSVLSLRDEFFHLRNGLGIDADVKCGCLEQQEGYTLRTKLRPQDLNFLNFCNTIIEPVLVFLSIPNILMSPALGLPVAQVPATSREYSSQRELLRF